MMMNLLFCNCAYSDIIPADRKEEILAGLRATGIGVTVVPDLCSLAADGAPLLAEYARKPALHIVACHARAVRWLFHRGGAPLASDAAVLNMRMRPAAEILATLTGKASVPAGESPLQAAANPSNAGCATCAAADACGVGGQRSAISHQPSAFPDSTPWFPVIDYDRCTNCKQCLEFCLFGVYEAGGDGKVAVTQPANCKTNCPACARICPQTAIVFPKVGDEPINGAEVRDEASARAHAQVNLTEYLGENIYAALAVRKMRRKEMLLKKRPQEAPP